MPFELHPATPARHACLRFFGHLTVPELQRSFLARISARGWRYPILLDTRDIDHIELPPAAVTAVASFVVRWAARLRPMGRVALLVRAEDVETTRLAVATFPAAFQAQMCVVTTHEDAVQWLDGQPPADTVFP